MTEINVDSSNHEESILQLTFDYVSSFIVEYFNFLNQQKLFDTFDQLFNEKLGLIGSENAKFSKANFGLIRNKFTEEVGCSMENILIESLRNEKREETHSKTIVNKSTNFVN